MGPVCASCTQEEADIQQRFETETPLAKIESIEAAKRYLAEARNFDDITDLRDKAIVAYHWAKARGADEAAQMAVEIKLRSERKAGQFIADMKEAGTLGDGKFKPVAHDVPPQITLKDMGVERIESQRWQKIAAIPEEDFEAKIVTAKKKTQAMFLETAHVGQSSGEFEWYTPQDYIEAARLTMGTIDVDPASSDAANKIVKAEKYFTINDDGLKQNWYGNVWMNPPYSQPLITQFCNLLVEKYKDGEVEQACVLVNNATETQHYQTMLEEAKAVCFIKGRVKFIDKDGNSSGAPLQGQTILYFGNEAQVFAENFSYFGRVLFG